MLPLAEEMTNSGIIHVCTSAANRSTTHTSVVCAACRCEGGREGEGEKKNCSLKDCLKDTLVLPLV